MDFVLVGLSEKPGMMHVLKYAVFFFSLYKDNEKRTPLHAAAYLGDAEIIELLILSGKHTSEALHIPAETQSYYFVQ